LIRLELTAIAWDIVLYNVVRVDRRFKGAYCLHYHPDDQQFPEVKDRIKNQVKFE
jgi:hypothetical protein